MKTLLRTPAAHALLLVVLGLLAYSNTFHAPFELDDLASIVENPAIRDLSTFFPGGEGYLFHSRRWVGYATFALNYRLWGMSLPAFHAVNLAVHLGAALLVYSLVRLTFRTPKMASSRLRTRAGTVALLAALFFLLHPVQTQAVTYVVQRLTSLAALLYVLALVLYASGRLVQEEKGTCAKAVLLLVGSAVPALLAMQTKETSLTLPLAAALYEVSFFRGGARRRMLSLAPLLLLLPLLPLQALLGDAVGDAARAASNPELVSVEIPTLHYFLTQFRVVVTYLRLLLLPVGQNLDYDYPVYTSPLAPPVFFSFLLLSGLFAAGVLLHLRSSGPAGKAAPLSRDPALRLASYGLFWFFLALSVESSFLSLQDVIFEHRLYLPSVGLFSALAVGIGLASEATQARARGRLPLYASCAVLCALAVATFQRNGLWGSNILLWSDTAQKSPGKVRPWYNLGTHLADGGHPEESLPAFQRALAMAPRHADAWHNLGRAYLMLGRLDEALEALAEAVRLRPDLDKAVVNLAVAFLKANRPAEAVPLLERIRDKAPQLAVPRLNLGLAYAGVGNLPAAAAELAFLEQNAPPLAAILGPILARSQGAARR